MKPRPKDWMLLLSQFLASNSIPENDEDLRIVAESLSGIATYLPRKFQIEITGQIACRHANSDFVIDAICRLLEGAQPEAIAQILNSVKEKVEKEEGE